MDDRNDLAGVVAGIHVHPQRASARQVMARTIWSAMRPAATRR
jgi:hypothetical protein